MSYNDIEIKNLIENSKQRLASLFLELDEISEFNQKKVLDVFNKNKLSLRHFSGSTGYGYGDEGRDTLRSVYADVFNAESAIVSPNIVSGTHAIALALYSVLKPGDRVLSVSGAPYDTLDDIINGENMSLKSMGVKFDSIDLVNADFDYSKILYYLSNFHIDMIYIQRSRGYMEREALSVEKIAKLVDFVRKNNFTDCIFVDNCYGEFVENLEPTDVGVDLVAGSLIKNIGGGLAPTGGYVVGKKKYVDLADARLTAPNICGEVGSYAFGYQYFYQGLFMAPHTVNQALKGSLLIGDVLSQLGYDTIPKPLKKPYDITRSVKMGNEKALVSFINAIQSVSPVDSYLTCEAWDMPGYKDKVIMAAGCFVQGSSIELSADAPIRPPFIAYIQGGLTFEHSIIALKQILKSI